jgi:hypothetical protein
MVAKLFCAFLLTLQVIPATWQVNWIATDTRRE